MRPSTVLREFSITFGNRMASLPSPASLRVRLLNHQSLFLILVVLAGSAYWIGMRWQYGEVPFSVVPLYRYGENGYYTMIAGLAHLNFGESIVYELRGSSIKSFPIISVLPHAFAYRIFGVAGLMLIDLLVFLAYYWILSKTFITLHISPLISRVASLLMATGVLSLTISLVYSNLPILDNYVLLTTWGMRLPRPFIVDPLLVLCIYGIARLAFTGGYPIPNRLWLLLAIANAALIQADIYASVAVTASIFVITALLVSRNPEWVKALRGFGLYLGVMVLLLTPFLIQRIFEHPDLPFRLGLYPVDRFGDLGFGRNLFAYMFLLGALATVSGYAALSRIKLSEFLQERLRGILALGLLTCLSLLSMSISIFLLGQMAQPHHFTDRIWWFFTFTAIVVLLLSLDFLYRYSLRTWSTIRKTHIMTLSRIGAITLAAVLATSSILISAYVYPHQLVRQGPLTDADIPAVVRIFSSHARVSGDALSHYDYNDFAKLVRELQSDKYDDALVMGTLTGPLAHWWIYSRIGFSYLPESAQSTVPDSELEARLTSFGRLIGMTPEDFHQFLGSHVHGWGWWIGHYKYNTNSGHTFSPISDYTDDAQEAIRNSGPFDSSMFFIPISEQRRLIEKFQNSGELTGRLDIIVLENTNNLPYWNVQSPGPETWLFGPPKKRFEQVYQNETFTVWKRNLVNDERSAKGLR